MEETILAYLTPKLTNRYEDLATQALCYLLSKYPLVAQSFCSHIASRSGVSLSSDLTFEAQVYQLDGVIPDLVGQDRNGRTVLIVESKFWASLTENQPVRYIDHLSSDTIGVLLFVVPNERVDSLWKTLCERCTKAGISVSEQSEAGSDSCRASLNGIHILGLTRWDAVLTQIEQDIANSDNELMKSEIWQLRGLCRKIETDGFRILQRKEFPSIVDTLVTRLVDSNIAVIKGYRATPGAKYYKRYMSLGKYANWCVEFNDDYWRKYNTTPFWLTIARKRLSVNISLSLPSGVPHGNQLLIPLKLPADIEQKQVEDIIESLFGQVKAVKDLLSSEQL